MKKIGALLGVLSLLSLAPLALAVDNLPMNAHRASVLIGSDVENLQGESLGDIEDVVFDANSGRIAYVVVSTGGVLGVGEKLHAVPWNALQRSSTEEKTFTLNIEKERFASAPSFDKNNWPAMADQSWGTTIHSYYGQKPYWEERRMMSATVQSVEPTSETVTLRADRAMLETLQAGESIEVSLRGSLQNSPVGVSGVQPDATGTLHNVPKLQDPKQKIK